MSFNPANTTENLESITRYVFWLKREDEKEWGLFHHFFPTMEACEDAVNDWAKNMVHGKYEFVLVKCDMSVVREL